MLQFVFISFLAILMLSDRSVLAASDCFILQGDSYTKPSTRTDRVSPGIECPESGNNQSCSLDAGGYLRVSSTLNITVDSSTDVFNAVRQVTTQPFKESVVGTVNPAQFTLLPGTTAYAGFTVTYRCYRGVLGDCVKGIDAGTILEACEPATLDSAEFPILLGTLAIVQTDNIANMMDNPAAVKPPQSLANRVARDGILPAIAVMGLVTALVSF